MQETASAGALKIKADVPAVKPYSFRKHYLGAVDKGIKLHRGSYIQRHFSASAYSLYPAEYAAIKPKGTTAKKALTVKERARLKLEYSALNARVATVRDPSNLDPQNKRPLYHTGRTHAIATRGLMRHVGQPNTRRGVINGLPFYLRYIPGAIRALQAVHPQENEAFAKTVSAELQPFLDGKGGAQ